MLKNLKNFLQFKAIHPLIFLVNKPIGFSSFTIVDIFQKILNDKVGHAGTLDPLATGELLLLAGHTTKLTDKFITRPKQYQATFIIGLHTDSYDLETPIVRLKQYDTSKINKILISKTLKLLKKPKLIKITGYSAIKRNGTPLYLNKKGTYKEMAIQNYKIISTKIVNKDNVIKKISELASIIASNKALYLEISKTYNIKPRKQQLNLFNNLLLKLNQNINTLKMSKDVQELFILKAKLRVTKGTYIRSIAQQLEKYVKIPTTTLLINRINTYK